MLCVNNFNISDTQCFEQPNDANIKKIISLTEIYQHETNLEIQEILGINHLAISMLLHYPCMDVWMPKVLI